MTRESRNGKQQEVARRQYRPGDMQTPVPHNTDAEMALLGGLCAFGETAFDDVLAVLTDPAAFYTPAHGKLFSVLVAMFEKKQPIELLAVEEELRRRELLDFIGGREYLLSLDRSYVDPRVDHYAKVVRDKWLRRRMMKVSIDLYNDALAEFSETDELPARYAKSLDAIAESQTDAEVEDLRDVIRRVPAQVKSASMDFIPTGFLALDHNVGGIEFPSYAVLAARPSVGKTAVGLAWAINAAQCGVDSVFISVEMRRDKLAQRALASLANTPIGVMRERFSIEQIEAEAAAAIDAVGPGRIVLTDKVSNIREACALARSYARRGAKLVVVDYLQLCKPDEKRSSRVDEIEAISGDLKNLNRQHGVTVLALAQLNRESAKANQRPSLHDLKGSGAIEQDADMVFLLHTPDSERRSPKCPMDVDVAKNRNGPLGRFDYLHVKATGRFIPEKPV